MTVSPVQSGGALPRIVALGGGTGLSTVLRGLKDHAGELTAIVTVGDDGGSSGLLRKDFGIQPPGDVRNCLVALSEAGPTLEALFQYRFDSSDLKGHTLGNLFLIALTKVTGDFNSAVREATRVLHVKGRVLPAAREKFALVATHADGSKSTGEVAIGKSRSPIVDLELRPPPPEIDDEVRDAIVRADIVLLGPGSLYTSVIPHLLVAGMRDALLASPAVVAYCCNVMTEPGETAGYTARDHLAALLRFGGPTLVDAVLVNDGRIPEAIARKHAATRQQPVVNDLGDTEVTVPEAGHKRVRVIARDFAHIADTVRHDTDRVVAELVALRELRVSGRFPVVR